MVVVGRFVHDGGMKPPPKWLPGPNSRKWHGGRSLTNSLGYFRVRSLANPKWQRNYRYVEIELRFDRPADPGPDRDLIDTALRCARDWHRMAQRAGENDESFDLRREAVWDQMLTAIDEFLERRQAEHLRAVEQAGASGRIPWDQDPAAEQDEREQR